LLGPVGFPWKAGRRFGYDGMFWCTSAGWTSGEANGGEVMRGSVVNV